MPRGVPKEGRVDNTLLREAFIESGLTWREVAFRMGLTQSKADNIRKGLGLAPDKRDGRCYYRQTMREEDAVRVAKALHKLPYEMGF